MKLSLLTSALAASAVVSAMPNPGNGNGKGNNGKAIGKGLKGPQGRPDHPGNHGMSSPVIHGIQSYQALINANRRQRWRQEVPKGRKARPGEA